MKKLLLASTALVATAGLASAEVAITGSAEIGIAQSNAKNFAEFFQDVDVRFKMTGESDGGIAFGATIDLDDATQMTGGINNTDRLVDYNVFVSAQGLTLTMGDTDGAFDKALTEVNLGGAGSINDAETSHAGFSGNGGISELFALDNEDVGAGLDGLFDGQVARLDYAVSGVTLSLSVEEYDEADLTIGADNKTFDNVSPVIGVGANYEADLSGVSIGLGLGYQVQEDVASSVGVSAVGSFAGGFSAGINYSVTDYTGDIIDEIFEDDVKITHVGVGFGYEMNSLGLGLNWGQYTIEGDGGDDVVLSGIGFAANYDLGGGLVAQFGYGGSELEDRPDFDTFSLGLAMSF